MKRILLLTALVATAALAASTFTTNYSLEKPADGDTNWGSSYRSNLDTIDTQLNANAGSVTNHTSDTSAAHAATAISSAGGATVCTTSDDVEEYLDCLAAQIGGVVGGEVVLLTTNQTVAGVKTFSSAVTGSAGMSIAGGASSVSGGTITLTPTSYVNVGNSTSKLRLYGDGVTLPSGQSAGGGISFDTANDTFGIFTPTQSAANSAPIVISTGNNTAAGPTGDRSGVVQILTGDSTNDQSGAITLQTGTAGTTRGIITLNGSSVTLSHLSTAGVVKTSAAGVITSSASVDETEGGTGTTTFTQGDILYSDASNSLAKLAKNTSATRYLSNTGTSNNPAWAQVDLSNGVTSTLPIANGGTNNGSLGVVAGGVYYGDGSKLAQTSAGTSGQFLKSNGSSAPAFTSFTAPTIQKFTSGSGTYTTPAGVLYIKVIAVGGGGGGEGTGSSPVAPGSGGNTTFGTSLITAGGGTLSSSLSSGLGGAGGTCTATGLTAKLAIGGRGQTGGAASNSTSASVPGGIGGSSAFGGAGSGGYTVNGTNGAANTGGGGGGGSSPAGTGIQVGGGGGGAGCTVEAIIEDPDATYAYSVGAGGTAGSANSFSGGAGGSGVIIVEEYYQ